MAALLDAAPPTDAPAPAPPPLGYRGVRLSSGAGGVSWLAFGGIVVEERPGQPPRHRLDAGRRIERAAIATAPPGALPASWLGDLLQP